MQIDQSLGVQSVRAAVVVVSESVPKIIISNIIKLCFKLQSAFRYSNFKPQELPSAV